MKKFYSYSLFLFFIILSCKSKPANPRTTFFNFLKGRTISGPAEFWHMTIKGKDIYFFSDVHESEKGGCSNCSGPTCARIEETFAEYFKKSNSHFFIESEFQNKDTKGTIYKRLNPAFLSKTIDLFAECLSNSKKKDLDSSCKQKYPNTFFHYADIRDVLIKLKDFDALRNYRAEILSLKEKGDLSKNTDLIDSYKKASTEAKKTITLTQKNFNTKENLKKFADLFMYADDFFNDVKGFLNDNTFSFKTNMKPLYNYENGPHKINKQITSKKAHIPDSMQQILKAYYEEEMEKTFNIYYPNYDENIKKVIALETSTDIRLVFHKDLQKFDMLVFYISYLLSNIYALGRMIRFLEDPNDTKDFVLYWGGSHIQHFLQFFSKHYKTPIKPAAIEVKDFRCIKVL